MSCSEEWNAVLYPVPVRQSECSTVSCASPSVGMWYCILCQSVSQNVVLYPVPVHEAEHGTVSSASPSDRMWYSIQCQSVGQNWQAYFPPSGLELSEAVGSWTLQSSQHPLGGRECRETTLSGQCPGSLKTFCSVEIGNSREKKISTFQCIVVLVVPELSMKGCERQEDLRMPRCPVGVDVEAGGRENSGTLHTKVLDSWSLTEAGLGRT